MSTHPKSTNQKLGRPRDQRRALIKSLADSLILNESIETTLPKAKAVARYTEKLVGKAKKSQSSLHRRRQVIAGLNTVEAAHKLVDQIAPALTSRNSGYFRVELVGVRQGDNAQLAKVSFVDELKNKKKDSGKNATKQDIPETKKTDEQTQPGPSPLQKSTADKPQPKSSVQAPKRSGVRGNR
jgi:large subunit ribosomal protein L17